MTVTGGTSPVALEATAGLLKTQFDVQGPFSLGYVDLLGEDERVGSHMGQRPFRSSLVPKIYERFWRPLVARFLFGRTLPEAEERRLVLQMLDLSPGDRVLDVGCGPGNYTRLIADSAEGGLVVGIDASAAMIDAASRRGGDGIAYVRGDGGGLPFKDAQFNAVCCVGVIHILEDPMAALKGMVRMLSPGGRIALGATCRYGRAPRKRGGVTVFEPDELTNALSDLGLAQVEQHIAKRGQLVAGRKPMGGDR